MVTSVKSDNKGEKVKKQGKKDILKGMPASPGVVEGHVRILLSPTMIANMMEKEVLVASMTDPEYTPAILKALAIITDKGGKLCHAAIVAREMGIPAVVGTGNATKILKDGTLVTVNGDNGEITIE